MFRDLLKELMEIVGGRLNRFATTRRSVWWWSVSVPRPDGDESTAEGSKHRGESPTSVIGESPNWLRKNVHLIKGSTMVCAAAGDSMWRCRNFRKKVARFGGGGGRGVADYGGQGQPPTPTVQNQIFLQGFVFGGAISRGNASYAWRSLLVAQLLLKAGFCWSIGDGKSIRIAATPWIARPSMFQTVFPPWMLPALATVNVLLNPEGLWDVQHVGEFDHLYQHYNRKGWFSVKCAYWLAIHQAIPRRAWMGRPFLRMIGDLYGERKGNPELEVVAPMRFAKSWKATWNIS
ncbi:UNVERIFIED_CONTAM: hypothetical protein Sradi_1496400 [Sesamum radiatum]|uniref:Uncharacterized protein n=1 Tax=Sesamum radiatum TaxID=300843 RepID=A0AAW2U7P3_SESRA